MPLVRFDPLVPQVPLIHAYIRSSVLAVTEAHELSKAECGISCFARVRPAPVVEGVAQCEECFFEFNMVGMWTRLFEWRSIFVFMIYDYADHSC